MTDWTMVPTEEFWQEYAAVLFEANRRRVLSEAEARQDALNTEVLQATGTESGGTWAQPTGAHDAYPRNWKVTHNGKEWESLVAGNVWEPGVSGWREVTPPDTPPPAWVQPAGAHDAYALDSVVTHNGSRWKSTVDSNVWEPGVYGWDQVPAA